MKSIIYHKILACILESYQKCQNTGIVWDLKFPSGNIHRVNFVFPLCFCVVDMKGARQLCGMYDTANIQRPCVSCYCRPEDLHLTNKVCKPVIESHMMQIINSNNDHTENRLKQISQHKNASNAFFNIESGGWKYGIWGLCPSEVLHQFYEGVLIYALDEFLDNVLTDKYRANLEACVNEMMSCIKNQSSQDLFPRGVFTMGITRLKTMKGIEKFACIFYLSLFLNTSISQTVYFQGKKMMSNEGKQVFYNWKKLFETCCYYHDWMMKKSFSRSSLQGKHKKIQEFYQLFSLLVKRKGKGIHTIPKFHEFFHIIRNIERHGPPTGYATMPTESLHRPVKALSRNTQQQVESFTSQTGHRLYEKNVVDGTYDFVKCFAQDTYLGSGKKNRGLNVATANTRESSSLAQSRYGLFYARYNTSNKNVDFVLEQNETSQHVMNQDFTSHHLQKFFKTKLFYLIEDNAAIVYLPCYTTLTREGLSFRGLSREKSNHAGWAMFQWFSPNNLSILCPGKILTFIDFSTVTFKTSAVDVYSKNELHVILHSLTKVPQDMYGHGHSSICAKATLENKDYMYHCVSINTIYDSTFLIPNIGDKDLSNVLYVFPRMYHEENDDSDEEDDDELGVGWAYKF